MKNLKTLSLLAALLITVVTASGCSKGTKSDDDSVPSAIDATANNLGESDLNTAMGLETVNFAYDSFTLDAKGKTTLSSNAAVLKDNKAVKIQIEGHCDIRGGIQYNLALGEKRAAATKKYLEDMGVPGDRISTISFGKERLLDQGSTDAAHAKNRRANFVVTEK